ncbi:MAG: lysine biosynthesis protein LysX [Thermoproteota archaeon]|nr:lysine biosynthesis protein LysX [Thermoproteota archaeon]
MVQVCIIYDKIRFEERTLHNKIEEKGFTSNLIDGKSLIFNTDSKKEDFQLGDIIFQRVISHYRGLYITSCLESLGFKVINPFSVSETCGNKLLTTLALVKHNVATPHTSFAFSSDSAFQLMEKLGYPLVVKPLVGSWGRGVYQIKDRSAAEMLIDSREETGSPLSRIYYIQEKIDRPPRDIRCIVIAENIVASIYRHAAENEWLTNVATGGTTEQAQMNTELEEITLKAAKAVGGGILGIDLMEDRERGYLVHEINNTVEFRGASMVSGQDIAAAMIDYLVNECKK